MSAVSLPGMAAGFAIGVLYWYLWFLGAGALLRPLEKDFTAVSSKKSRKVLFLWLPVRWLAALGCLWGAVKLLKLPELSLCIGLAAASAAGLVWIAVYCLNRRESGALRGKTEEEN